MSTQTVRTEAGSRFPVAIEWSMVESIRHIRTPGISFRIAVVGRQRIAGEEDLDVAELDQPGEIAGGAGVDDRRPADDEDPALFGADLAHLGRDLLDQQLLGLLDRDVAGHEAEDLDLAR